MKKIKISYPRWYCKEHGLEGAVGKSWCLGCYKIDDNTDKPVPYIGYPSANKK